MDWMNLSSCNGRLIVIVRVEVDAAPDLATAPAAPRAPFRAPLSAAIVCPVAATAASSRSRAPEPSGASHVTRAATVSNRRT